MTTTAIQVLMKFENVTAPPGTKIDMLAANPMERLYRRWARAMK